MLIYPFQEKNQKNQVKDYICKKLKINGKDKVVTSLINN